MKAREQRNDQRHLALDGVRGVAILCIFFHHSVTHALSSSVRDVGTGFWGGTVAELRLSLICFFVLSGFLLWGSFSKALREDSGLKLGQYVKRRSARVFPAYYLAILGSIALLWGAHMPNLNLPTTGELPLFAVFGQNYSPSTMEALDGPTWTLCIEVAFYVALPLLAVALWRLRAGPRLQYAFLGGLFAFGVAWRLPALGGHGDVWAKALPAYLPYFAIGMALAVWNQHRDRSRPRISPAATFGLLGASAALVVANGVLSWTDPPALHGALTALGDIPAATGFALLLLATIVGSGPGISWLQWRPLVGLGVISYGFYLWHLPVMLYWRRLGIGGGPLETAAITFPVVLAISVASWKLVEAPILRRAHAPAASQSTKAERLEKVEQPPRRRRGTARPVRARPVSVSDLT